jgi:hypothetical protein
MDAFEERGCAAGDYRLEGDEVERFASRISAETGE